MNPLRTLAAAWREVPRVWPLMRDPAIPAFAKFATVAAAGLIISPLDLLGDIPLLGQIDDVILLGFVVHLFVKFSERVLARTNVVHNVTPHAPSDAIALR